MNNSSVLQTKTSQTWRQFAARWTDSVARTQYATHVLGHSPRQAFQFARAILPSETLRDIKRWQHEFLEQSVPESAEFKFVCSYIRQLSESVGKSDFQSSIARLREVFGRVEFNLLRQAAWSLTTGTHPVAGFIVGSVMLESDHPKDGEALIRQALRIFEEEDWTKAGFQQLISDFRAKFPVE